MKKAFEIEDINNRNNFVMLLDDKKVLSYDTSRGAGNTLELTYTEEDGNLVPTFCTDFVLGGLQINPLGCKSAEEYFNKLKDKAMTEYADHGVAFLWWVNPETFEPLNKK